MRPFPQDSMDLAKQATAMRKAFEGKSVSKELLAQLYMNYWPMEDIHTFMAQAQTLFPRLNCGIATVYVQHVLQRGKIVQGKYGKENHTFLLVENNTIVDITADQYGGPKVYVGPVQEPWHMPEES